ncbi:lipoprotein signal peptidase [Xylanimonas cellulosilytica DSM 15894]|uniref:Lipoprotein signal peptidase n=1 Tax=Xylanimonas cellulosilytica (strain DSM 15894 / JCM 12276 / CECT 5975 / KCTC 9989 / LMG 20990 / NBRC 107835 / XIL07) TaxID=446471 RepID=D1C0D5_XYLCX|nr:signal peptidase II [Xylanimonas cellulosilytica]ACZ30324.1 lipoprotein signal peptidase [Xylanimonas cellulosilytica DSM 15894]
MSTEPAVPTSPEPSAPEPATPVPATPVPPASSRRLVLFTFLLAALVLAVDQATKQWALSALELGAPQHNLIGEFLSLRLVLNPGAALGIGYGYTWVLTILVVAVVIVIVRVISKIRSRAWAVTLGLLLGGAVGNLVDRLLREPGFAHGHVVDFIGYWNWFTGNVADIAIVVAAVMLALLSLMGIGLDGQRESDREAASAAGTEVAPEPEA